MTNGQEDIIIGTRSGYSVRFNEATIRSMGRSATGVRGVKLREEDWVVGASRINDKQEVLVITENGYGKRTSAAEYPTKGRGGKGIKTANITAKNGQLAGLMTVDGNEDIVVITTKGVIIRTNVSSISQTGRSTLGVKVMRLDTDSKIVTFTLVQAEDNDPTAITQTDTALAEAPINSSKE